MMNYIGIDVSKAKIDVLWLKDTDQLKIKAKALSNNLAGFKQLVVWLDKNLAVSPSNIRIVLEATGVYHEALAYFLHDHGYIVSVINPAYIRKFADGLGTQHKTDKTDSFILARYGFLVQPPVWQPEPKPVRQLKALIARVDALKADLQREENRLEKADATDTPDNVVASIHDMIHSLNVAIAKLTQDIDDHVDGHPDLKNDQNLLESIPGVGKKVALSMLALIHSRSFENADQLTAFVGLIPKHRESGVFRGRTTLSKNGNRRIRALLYFPAVVATKYNDHIKAQYHRLLKAGKTKMQAIGAAMRKLVQLCFGVLKNKRPYDAQYQAA